MQYLFDDNGTLLTVTTEGVTMPASYSFALVNDLVHNQGVTYEDLEGSCLDMASTIDSMQAKIDSLMIHYCPDEMTEEQLEEYGRCQVKSKTVIKE